MAKNVTDLAEALVYRGFEVTQAIDLDEAGLRSAVSDFVKRVDRAPAGAVSFFYYAGHGLQLNSNNLLLAAGSNPAAPRGELLTRSLVLQRRLLSALPARADALTITVIDACRTDLRAAVGDGDGMNQVEAPVGGLVCFSTAAGRPAVSPASPDQNTFYTAALVQALRSATDSTTFDEMFRMVNHNVQKTMLAHPVEAIRRLAQSPFMANNARLRVRLGGAQHPLAPMVNPPNELEESDWRVVCSTTWPPDLLVRSAEFMRKYPQSPHLATLQLDREGALQALAVLRDKDVRLYKTSFVMPSTDADPDDLQRAARGDKDASARIARQHRALNTELGKLRFEGWLQFASGLGNGIACYELALHYRAEALPAEAAAAEAKAQSLGYSPPRSLEHERK